MWPKLSNINKDIHDKITNRNNLEASKLNCWVRLFSGVGDGLIMVSNPDTKLFAAAGEGGIYGFAGNATEAGYSGRLGQNWEGISINPEPGRSLRPSPMVTSLEFSEGEDQISRSGKISLTAFSLEQLEIIQQFFMEPGYSLFIEWGWNTTEGVSGLIKTDNVALIPNLASAGNLIQSTIRKKALDTDGDYDNMLGFIVGGGIGNDGENFSVEIELRGTPELPTFLQSQNVTFQTTGAKKDGIIKVEGAAPFQPDQLIEEDEKDTDGSQSLANKRRFRSMFNALPSKRQTSDVKKGVTTQYTDFVNHDGLITENINSWLQTTWWDDLRDEDKLEIDNFQIEKEKLFSNNKYIKLDTAFEIIQKSGLNNYEVGGVTYQVNIDVSNTKIGAFPLMFSTKAESLLIPGKIPNFELYYLNTDKPTYKSVMENPVDNKIGGNSFVQFADSTTGHSEAGGYWGYLKNLYINQEMMVNKMTAKNKTIKDVLYDILNECSAAVNSFWNFQIVEGEKNGNKIITVVDRNWVGKKIGTPKEFHHNGEASRFLSSALTIDIPGEMANQIISQRLGASGPQDAPILKTNSFFAKGTDKFMRKLNIRGDDSYGSEPDPESLAGIAELKEDEQQKIDDIVGTNQNPSLNGGGARSSSSSQKDADGNVISTTRYSDNGVDTTVYQQDKYDALNKAKQAKRDLEKAEAKIKEGNLAATVDKIDLLPNPEIISNIVELLDKSGDELLKKQLIKEGVNQFSKTFKIYTFKDTNLFDYIRQSKLLKSRGSLSHPLPIKYSFTILGTSGIRRGDMFNIVGIPEKYRKQGLFQVNAVTHSIEGMKWTTEVEGLYRQIQ